MNPKDIPSSNRSSIFSNKKLLFSDITLISIMMVVAACGLIYEFLISHYAARVLAATEVAIFGIFTIMITSMGLGAFAAKRIKDPYTGFVALELTISVIGATAIVIIAFLITATYLLPSLLAETYGISGAQLEGGLVDLAQKTATHLPYVVAFILGVLIGAEIPLIARVREDLYGRHLKHNAGTIYGADYIGGGIGAALFVLLLLTMPPIQTGVIVATINLLAGAIFFYHYRAQISWRKSLIVVHLIIAIIIVWLALFGSRWTDVLEDMLYRDTVIHSMTTRYQRVVITERNMGKSEPKAYSMFINGHTQFYSRDEHIYHSMLTYPVLAASARRENILVIGGGDGLAVRDILRWNPKSVTLIDLDPAIVEFFTRPHVENGKIVNSPLLALNKNAFSDKRVQVEIGDAFVELDAFINQGRTFDAIIIDLPDPNHPDLNKLYSTQFYAKTLRLLAGDGAIGIQSSSPYHAKNAFLSIGKTVKHAGYANVEQYHTNVPSFGEWGWTIATPRGKKASRRIDELEKLPIDDDWITKEIITGAFTFNKGFYDSLDDILVNRLHSSTVYEYHREGWARENGVF